MLSLAELRTLSEMLLFKRKSKTFTWLRCFGGFGGSGIQKTVKPFECDGGSVNDYRTDLDLTVAHRKTVQFSADTQGADNN